MSEKIFRVNYKRHEGQREVLKGILSSPESFIYPIICSRGWGKTVFATCDLVLPQLLKQPHAQAMWVAPTYKIAKAAIDDVWNGIDEKSGELFIPKYDIASGFQFWDWKAADMEVHLFNQSKLFLRSATNPDSIVAKGYNIIIIDEAALLDKEVFMKQILPTARRKGVKIFIITTPRGLNWVYELYLAGQDPSKPEYMSFRQPWWKRPDYPEVLKILMKDLPEHIRKQEFDAEFIGDGGQLFKNLATVFKGPEISFPGNEQEWERPIQDGDLDGDTFVMSVDIAKSMDYTVIMVLGINSKKCWYYRRLNKKDYKYVLEAMRRVAETFNADVIFDATGVGAGLGDFMNRIANVHPFLFTNESKNEIINRLIVACEYGEIELPNITTIKNEFELFTYEVTKTGKISYNAPDGKHDDTVIAAALALYYAQEAGGQSQVDTVEDFMSVIESIRRPKSRLEQMMEEDDQ